MSMCKMGQPTQSNSNTILTLYHFFYLFCFFFHCSPAIIDYDGYYVSLRELAESMKKFGFLKSHVFKLIVESIMRSLPADSKKTIMPVRFSVILAFLS